VSEERREGDMEVYLPVMPRNGDTKERRLGGHGFPLQLP